MFIKREKERGERVGESEGGERGWMEEGGSG